jgi:hypothetical protein
MVDRPELAPGEAEVVLHALELVDRIRSRGVDRAEADEPRRVARDVVGDVVVRDDEPRSRGVEREDDGAVDAVERPGVVLFERAAQLHVRPGLPRLRREPLLDVARVLADVCMNVDDHGRD